MNNNDDIQWPVSMKQLINILGSTRSRLQNINTELGAELIEGTDYKWGGKKGSPLFRAYFKEGAIKFAKKLRSEEAAIFLSNEGIEKKQRITLESHYMGIIKEALKNITPAYSQYSVDHSMYRIDLYLPDMKLAIECDERGHENYNICRHELRQVYLEHILQCEFIRFDPDKDDFNLGTVLNRIFLKIMESKKL